MGIVVVALMVERESDGGGTCRRFRRNTGIAGTLLPLTDAFRRRVTFRHVIPN